MACSKVSSNDPRAMTDGCVSLQAFARHWMVRCCTHACLPFVYEQHCICVCVSPSLDLRRQGVSAWEAAVMLYLLTVRGWRPPFPASLPHQATLGLQDTTGKATSQTDCIVWIQCLLLYTVGWWTVVVEANQEFKPSCVAFWQSFPIEEAKVKGGSP